MDDCSAMPRRNVLPLLPIPIAPTAQATARGFIPLLGLPGRTGVGQHRSEGWFMPGVNDWSVREFKYILTADGCKNTNGRCVLHVETDEQVLRSGAHLALTSHRLQGAHFSEVVVEYSNEDNNARIPHKKGWRHPWGQVARTSSKLLEVQSDVSNVSDVPVEIVGRMVGAGYHWVQGVLCPSVPDSERKNVLKRKRDESSTARDSDESCASAQRTINMGSLSKLEACTKIFNQCFSGGPFDGHTWTTIMKVEGAFSRLRCAVSSNLTNRPHRDLDAASKCFAIWVRKHISAPPPKHWWLLFPSVGLAIQLEHGVRISWNGRCAQHCSISVPGEGDELLSLIAGTSLRVQAHRET